MLSHLTKDYKKDISLLKLPETSKFQIPYIKIAALLEEHGLKSTDSSSGVILLIKNCISSSLLLSLEEKIKSKFIKIYENIDIKHLIITPQSTLPKDFNKFVFKRVRISDSSFRKNSGSFSAIYLGPKGLRKNLYFRFEIEAILKGFKAKHNLSKGTILTLEAVEPTHFSLSTLNGFPVVDFNSNDWIIKHYVRKDSILLKRHLKQKPLVARDDYVDALVKDGGLVITIGAKILSNGNKGDIVRIRTNEGKIFNALVISNSKVIIKE